MESQPFSLVLCRLTVRPERYRTRVVPIVSLKNNMTSSEFESNRWHVAAIVASSWGRHPGGLKLPLFTSCNCLQTLHVYLHVCLCKILHTFMLATFLHPYMQMTYRHTCICRGGGAHYRIRFQGLRWGGVISGDWICWGVGSSTQ
jgi:hypothetical protein